MLDLIDKILTSLLNEIESSVSMQIIALGCIVGFAGLLFIPSLSFGAAIIIIGAVLVFLGFIKALINFQLFDDD